MYWWYLGNSITDGLAEIGAHVFITSRYEDKALITKNSFSDEIVDNIDVEVLDMISAESIKKCFDRIKNYSNKIDILVNDAGHIPSENFENMSEKVEDDF